MANIKKQIITTAGLNLIAKFTAGTVSSIGFTKLKIGDGQYTTAEQTDAALLARTSMKSEKNNFAISAVTQKTSTSMAVRSVISNSTVTEGYYVREFGLYAQDTSTSTEILFAIAIAEDNKADFLPTYNGTQPVEVTVDDYIEVSNANAFTLVYSEGAFATSQMLDDVTQSLEEQIDLKLNISLKGAPDGLAELVGGKVPSTQLPSYVDDVLEYKNLAAFPTTGEGAKIYLATDTGKSYRWGGSSYAIVSDPDILAQYGLGDYSKDISGTDLYLVTKGGKYRGQNVTNAPSTGWFYFDIDAHNSTSRNVTAKRLSDGMRFEKNLVSGAWDSWTELATVNSTVAKANATTFETAGGTATVITLANAPLTAGVAITFVCALSNSGAATTINGKSLYKPGGTSAPNLVAGKAYTVWYNGTNFFIKASAEGDAVAANVLANKTFSSDLDTGLIGTMVDRGAITITPSTVAQIIPQGYHNGSGTVTALSKVIYGIRQSCANPPSAIGISGTSFRPVEYKGAIHMMIGDALNNTRLVKYDVPTNTWLHVSYHPSNVMDYGMDYALVVIGNELHVLYGLSHYAWNGTVWTQKSTMVRYFRGVGSVVALGNEIHLIRVEDGIYTGHWKWDGSVWSKVSDIPFARVGCSAVVFNNEIHLLGGKSSTDSEVDWMAKTHSKFNGTVWTQNVSTLPQNHAYGNAVILGGYIFLLGTWDGSELKGTCYYYDGLIWTQCKYSEGSLASINYVGGACVTLGDTIHSIGASNYSSAAHIECMGIFYRK